MNMTNTRKHALITASGGYLTAHLPDDFDLWDEERLDQFLLDNMWEPFEFYSAHQIWEVIDSMADDIVRMIGRTTED